MLRWTVLAVLATSVAGCGVRGSLDAPQAAGAPAAEQSQKAPADSGQGKKEGEAPKPHKYFILDGLLR